MSDVSPEQSCSISPLLWTPNAILHSKQRMWLILRYLQNCTLGSKNSFTSFSAAVKTRFWQYVIEMSAKHAEHPEVLVHFSYEVFMRFKIFVFPTFLSVLAWSVCLLQCSVLCSVTSPRCFHLNCRCSFHRVLFVRATVAAETTVMASVGRKSDSVYLWPWVCLLCFSCLSFRFCFHLSPLWSCCVYSLAVLTFIVIFVCPGTNGEVVESLSCLCCTKLWADTDIYRHRSSYPQIMRVQ